MDSLEIKTTREGAQAIVHRQHDLSGTDYAHVVSISREVADAIHRNGLAVWGKQPPSVHGRPGVVLTDAGEGRANVQVRADVADPTTVIAEGTMPLDDARRCVPDDGQDLRWLVPPTR
jgi:hypothetical protein